MPDFVDRAQHLVDAHLADAMERHRAGTGLKRAGLTHCEIGGCGEPIEPKRTNLGARLCSDCQYEADIRARQYAPGRGR